MKPFSIADYLDHLGRRRPKAPPRSESSPFRPRSLPSVQNGEPRPRPAFNPGGAEETQAKEGPRRTPWERKPIPLATSAGPSPAGGEAVKLEDIAVRLVKLTRAAATKVSPRPGRTPRTAMPREAAAARREAETDRLEFERNEYALELEGAIRSGLKEIEDNVGAVVTRILAPFLDKQVVKRAADEFGEGYRPAGRAGFARVDDDSRPRARARALAPTDCRSAGQDRLCRRQERRSGRRGRRRASRDRASLLGQAACLARRLSGADGCATPGNRHRQTPRLA